MSVAMENVFLVTNSTVSKTKQSNFFFFIVSFAFRRNPKMLIVCPCSLFCCLLFVFFVSAYIYFSYISIFLLVAEGNTLSITAGSVNISIVRGLDRHNPAEQPPDDHRLAVNVNGPNRDGRGGGWAQPVDGGCSCCGNDVKNDPEPDPTTCFVALFFMSVCAFLFCTVFPEYCLRRRHEFKKGQQIISVWKKCGCYIEYSAIPSTVLEQP